MKAVLLVDVLGVKDRWKRRERNRIEAVRRLVNTFQIIVERLLDEEENRPIKTLMSGDSFWAEFTDPFNACWFGMKLFQKTYQASVEEEEGEDQYIWIRGVIVKAEEDERTWVYCVDEEIEGLEQHKVEYSNSFYESIFEEKSGYHGMRLLLKRYENSEDWREGVERVSYRDDGRVFYFVKKLQHIKYPRDGNYEDVLWIADTRSREFSSNEQSLQNKMKDCAKNESAFLQASTTNLLLLECKSILHSCGFLRD